MTRTSIAATVLLWCVSGSAHAEDVKTPEHGQLTVNVGVGISTAHMQDPHAEGGVRSLTRVSSCTFEFDGRSGSA